MLLLKLSSNLNSNLRKNDFVEGGFFFVEGEFCKIGKQCKRDFTFIREMRILGQIWLNSPMTSRSFAEIFSC